MRIITFSLFFSFTFCLFACKKNVLTIGEIINQTKRSISPFSINIEGIKLYQSIEDIQKIIGNIDCKEQQNSFIKCIWKRDVKTPHNYLKGIEQLHLTFYKNILQVISVHYGQMLDVEYKNFESLVREKYAYAFAGFVIDSTGLEWKYDSLKISLIPNKKQHWTGAVYVYTPVLNYEELTLGDKD